MKIPTTEKPYHYAYVLYVLDYLKCNNELFKKPDGLNDFISSKSSLNNFTKNENEKTKIKNALNLAGIPAKTTLDLIQSVFKIELPLWVFSTKIKDNDPEYIKYYNAALNVLNPKTSVFTTKLFYRLPTEINSSTNAENFYNGYPPSWEDIRSDFDFKRKDYIDSHKEELFSLAHNLSGLHFYIIKGPSGSGKSTLTKRIAYDLSRQFKYVFYLNTAFEYVSKFKEIEEELSNLIQSIDEKQIIIIDGYQPLVRSHLLNIHNIINLFESKKVLFIFCDNSINYKYFKATNQFPPTHITSEIEIPLLYDDEIDNLINKVNAYEENGTLHKIERKLGFDNIKELCKRKFERQLLVAMLQIRHGRSFPEIIINECNNLRSIPEYSTVSQAYEIVCLFQHAKWIIYDDLLYHALKIDNISGSKLLGDFIADSILSISVKIGLMIRNSRNEIFSRHHLIASEVYKSFFLNNAMYASTVIARIFDTDHYKEIKDAKYFKYCSYFFHDPQFIIRIERALSEDIIRSFLKQLGSCSLSNSDFRKSYLKSFGVFERDKNPEIAFKYFLKFKEKYGDDSFVYCQIGHLHRKTPPFQESLTYAKLALNCVQNEIQKLGVAKLYEVLHRKDLAIPILNSLLNSTDEKVVIRSKRLLRRLGVNDH